MTARYQALRASTEPRLTLGAGEAHLHVLFLEHYAYLDEHALLARFGKVMNPTEADKQARFVFEKGRREYLMTRALVRTTLARYLPRDADSFTFVENAYGKPSLADASLSFNLSNTFGCVVCLVARGAREVGADVEQLGRSGELVAIAESHFAESEQRALVRLPEGDAQRQRFFQYWTLKEAYIKARGMGISLPLDGFAFELDAPPEIGFTARADVDTAPASWQFREHSLSPDHLAATCVQREPGSDVDIVLYDASASPALQP